MKKAIGFGFLVLFLFFGVISEPSHGSTVSIPGKWSLTYDWNCDGSVHQYALYMYPDQTFRTADGGYGKWAQTRKSVKLIFTNGCKPKYTGSFSNDGLKMEGTMKCTPGQMKKTGGTGQGCWNAYKTDEPLPGSESLVDDEGLESSGTNSATP